jgi:hypothetical protein
MIISALKLLISRPRNLVKQVSFLKNNIFCRISYFDENNFKKLAF